ncbi:MAG: diguanylate cyclase [Magnetococcales bacterium]|nr:diguanylate cyclase [Magnetococcales bacterium]MBF0156539.1 diguanylate cyclase [Magnetococcales bacterium]
MIGALLGSLEVMTVVVLWLFLRREGRRRRVLHQHGWYQILAGFGLLTLAFLLRGVGCVGRSPWGWLGVELVEVAGFLEPVVLLGGTLLLAYGLVRWLPTITSLEDVESFAEVLVASYARLASSNLKLQEESDRVRAVPESANDAILALDGRGQITYWNRGAWRTFGFEEGEVIGQPVTKLIPDRVERSTGEETDGTLIPFVGCSDGATMEMAGRRKNGEEFPLEISVGSWTAFGDRHYAAVIRDISARKGGEKQSVRIQQSRVAISTLLQVALEPISLEDQVRRALEVILSVPWLRILSKGSIFLYDSEEKLLLLAAQRGFPDHLLKTCARLPLGHCLCGRAALEREVVFASHLDHRHDVTFPGISAHGHYCIPILFQGNVLGVINTYVVDGHQRNEEEEAFLVSMANTLAGLIERKRGEERLRHLAHHDVLTGLPNRQLFREILVKHIARSRRDRGCLALLFLDLDRFKGINDSLGHEVGDLLLQEVSQRIKSCLRESDLVARLGGDEFTVVLPDISGQGDAALVCRKIIEKVQLPFQLRGNQCNIGVSIGVALFPDHGPDSEALLKGADEAMYRVKRGGRNGYHFAGGEAVVSVGGA